MATVASVKDNFNDNALHAQWQEDDPNSAGTVTETGQQLEVALTTTTSTREVWCESVDAALDFTGSELFARVVQVAADALSRRQTRLRVQIDATNWVEWRRSGGSSFAAIRSVAGVETTISNYTYNSTTHAHWRISESGGVITWWTATDDGAGNPNAWTSRATWTSTFASITACQIRYGVVVGTNGEASTAPAIFDNLSGATDPPSLALNDNFDDNAIDAAKWESLVDGAGGATVAETGGKIVITPALNQAGQNWASIRSFAQWDLTGERYYVQVPKAIAGTATSQTVVFTPDVTRNGDFELSDNWMGWLKVGATLRAKQRVAGVTTVHVSITYDAVAHRYWAVREESGTIYWETSADRINWTVRASAANPFAVTALDVELRAGTENSSPNATTAEFDGFNSAPNAVVLALPTLAVPVVLRPLSVGGALIEVALPTLVVTVDLGGNIGFAHELQVLAVAALPQALTTSLAGNLAVGLPTLSVPVALLPISLGDSIELELEPLEVTVALQAIEPPRLIELPVLTVYVLPQLLRITSDLELVIESLRRLFQRRGKN